MLKVDIAITVMAVIAASSTGLGIVLYDDINDLTPYDIIGTEVAWSDSMAADTIAGTTFNESVPNNVYHSNMTLTVTMTNPDLANENQNVDITVLVTTPTGDEYNFTGQTQMVNGGTYEMDMIPSAWGQAPNGFSGTQADVDANTLNWTEPLTIFVAIQGPANQLGLQQANPTYQLDLAGLWHGYSIVEPTPDVGSI